jgi:hypothetical protein
MLGTLFISKKAGTAKAAITIMIIFMGRTFFVLKTAI